jgi:thioredoxin 1
MSENKLPQVSDQDFEQTVLQARGIVVVNFWTPRCGICHQMAPALEAFAEANQGRANVLKMDADDNPKTAEKYGIRSTPTTVFFENGESVDVTYGAMSKATLQSKLDGMF